EYKRQQLNVLYLIHKYLEIKAGKLIRLSAKNGLEENTIDNPTNIYPVENYVTTEKNGAMVEIPASSLNIIRLK
ncbi:MAG: hypothetical protein UEL26_08115, partial [Segatella copri]|nr:hypothetical protein [Segatella copri]